LLSHGKQQNVSSMEGNRSITGIYDRGIGVAGDHTRVMEVDDHGIGIIGDHNRIVHAMGSMTINVSRDRERSLRRVSENIRNCDLFIRDKVSDFVGRAFVFTWIENFMKRNSRGYLFIRGDPGIGKSSLMAQMVLTRGYIHHFNIRSEGINTAEMFLKNVCAQLIVSYDLGYESLPDVRDPGCFQRLLSEASSKSKGENVVILIDALDEADNTQPEGVNPLYIPSSVPEGVYIVITMRKTRIPPRIIHFEQKDIENDSNENIADVREYIMKCVRKKSIAEYVKKQEKPEAFMEGISGKSEYNFIYLYYVFLDIEKGSYKDMGIESFPQGLENYYEDHWKRMKSKDERKWFKYSLPVLTALVVLRYSVTANMILASSPIQDVYRVTDVLDEWSQFLREGSMKEENGISPTYRIYHMDFYEFIVNKKHIKGERVDLISTSRRIANLASPDLF